MYKLQTYTIILLFDQQTEPPAITIKISLKYNIIWIVLTNNKT